MNSRASELNNSKETERKQIQSVIDQQRRTSMIVEDNLCEICHKSKFVDQPSSRQCSICQKRFCLRCGIRLKNAAFLCCQCREKEEIFFSSRKNFSKQYSSDDILNRNIVKSSIENPKQNTLVRPNDEQISSNESISNCDSKKTFPQIRLNSRSNKILRDFRFHSLDERESPTEINLKDSGIDTASSSTILNVFSADPSQKEIHSVYFPNPIFRDTSNVDFDELFRTLNLRVETSRNEQNQCRTEIVEILENRRNSKTQNADPIFQRNCENVEIMENRRNSKTQNVDPIFQRNRENVEITGNRRNSKTQIVDPIFQRNSENVEITENQRNSRIQIGDQILEWNGENVEFASAKEFFQVVCRTSRKTPEIHLLVRRKVSKKPIEIELAFESDDGIFKLNIFGAKNIEFRHVRLLCQILVQEKAEQNLIEEKLSKTQICFSNFCVWNETIFFDNFRTTENLYFIVNLIKLDEENTTIGRLKISPSSTNFQRQFFQMEKLEEKENFSTVRKRKLPKIPSEKIEANREKLSQELLEKATELKIRLHLESKKNETEPTKLPNKEKTRLPMIRDKTNSNPNLFAPNRRGKFCRNPSETTTDEIDSDCSEFSVGLSRKFSRKSFGENFHRTNEVKLNDEELRQIEMKTEENRVTKPSICQSEIKDVEKNFRQDEKQDGTVSDSILTNQNDQNRKRRASMSSKALVILGLSKKSNSAANLGQNKRHGFQRSEEIGVQAHLRNRSLQRQTSKENEKPTSNVARLLENRPKIGVKCFSQDFEQSQSMPENIKLWSGALKLPHELPFVDFVEGLGAGQVVGRQVLASPCHGEIQIGLRDQQGFLEVEIVRARNLLQKPIYVTAPAPYVKIYLLDGKNCLDKQRTRRSRRTLDPLIQQTFNFKDYRRAKILQISVWGDYGKLDRRVFMGVCQINFNDLNLIVSRQILDWYKLFSANSLMNAYSIGEGNSSKRFNSTNNVHHQS